MGLAPIFIQELDIIEDIRHKDYRSLIEQNANKALSIADRGYVLETGKVVLSGTGEELLASDEVRVKPILEDKKKRPRRFLSSHTN